MPGRDSQEAFLAKILDHCTCEVCSKPLARADVVAVRRSDSMWLINIVCTACEARGLVFVLIRDAASMLDGEEIAAGAPETHEAVTLDDCRALHEFFRTFDGDCLDLIRALG